MVDQIEIHPVGAVRGSIRPPGSKSITNRAFVCAALADGTSRLRGALDSEDTRVMFDCLNRLGIVCHADWGRAEIEVDGRGGLIAAADAQLFVSNSGTTIRFLVAMLAACRGTFRLDGIERMRQRPIGDLIESLNSLGADVQSDTNNGCPPVTVRGRGLRGGTAKIRGNISSQYLSGIMMAAPYAERPIELVVDGELVSQPYVHMTAKVMASFGVSLDAGDLTVLRIPAPQRYRATAYEIEPDASAASYFWGIAAVTQGSVTVEGLGRDSLQGDVAFCDCLEKMGCTVTYQPNGTTVTGGRLRGINVNMNGISDTVQTLGVVALFAEGPTTVTGVGHIRHKETDRIGDLARELRKLGAAVDEFDEGLRITPGKLHGAIIDTYNDHRMAMSLALAGLRVEGVSIRDPRCTAKTYPHFFDDLNRLSNS